jgi:hypothetical protein
VVEAGPLVLDDTGNLYLAESVNTECRYVSLDPNGNVRWRQGSGQPAVCTPIAVDQPAGLLYAIQNGNFDAYSLADGKRHWRLGPGPIDAGIMNAMGIPTLSGHQSTSALLINSPSGMLVVDRATGALIRPPGAGFGPYISSVLGDGRGNFLYTDLDAGDPNFETYDLITLDSSAQVLSSRELGDWTSVDALSNDTLLLSSADVLQTELWSRATGTTLLTLDAGVALAVADDQTLWAIEIGVFGNTLVQVDLSSGAVRPSVSFGGASPDKLFATDRATVLAMEGDDLMEEDTRGVTRMYCPFRAGSDAAFGPERLYTKDVNGVAATALPGLSPATTGWVESRGNARGDNQPK